MNVPSDLLRTHAQLGMPTGPMGAAGDRAWPVGVCLTLGFIVALLVFVLR